ncbi:MAG: extracellular solute-binding protein [Pirellulales bacterium]|nr:extracellular solute-binding protein [Pirellulales bacterium]
MIPGRFPKLNLQFAIYNLQFAMLILCAGCWSAKPSEVVVYTALDAEFSRPIFKDFTQKNGVEVSPKFDTESTKTVGLAEAILAEGRRPRCDVFWNNEILHTVRLQRAGLLEAYRCPAAQVFPPEFRSPDGYWQGFAARARVLIVNTNLVPEDRRPKSILDLTAPQWQGRCGLAKPLFGTTATHAACLFAVWGDAKAKEFFTQIKKNQARILSGNKKVAQAVAAGQLAFGLTDTDDALIEVEKGMPVTVVYPDQGPDGLGTLFIPNTLAIIRGAPHPQQARRLIDYLLSPAVETKLAEGPSAQIPLNPKVHVKLRTETPETVRPMQVDFEKAADCWEAAAKYLRQEFTGG